MKRTHTFEIGSDRNLPYPEVYSDTTRFEPVQQNHQDLRHWARRNQNHSHTGYDVAKFLRESKVTNG